MKIEIKLLALFMAVLLCSNMQRPAPVNETKADHQKIVILAIDGGGIKGIIPAIFLRSIEDSLNMRGYQIFDIIGGTSTGGIIAAAVTTPKENGLPLPAAAVVDTYEYSGAKIFVPQKCKIKFCATYYAAHGHKGVEPFLKQFAGSTFKLSDAYEKVRLLKGARVKQMFTTSYIVNSTGGKIANPEEGKDYGPYLFNWYDATHQSSTDDYYVWEAARGTSAAPIYFPVAHVGGQQDGRSTAPEKWVVDGGVMSNNPAVWALSEAYRTGIATDKTLLSDIILISLGTGSYHGANGVGIKNNSSFLVPKNGNWSETPWIFENLYNLEGVEDGRGTIVNIILDAVQMVSDQQLISLRKGGLQYYRLEPSLTESQAAMDNISAKNIKSLKATAEQFIKSGDGRQKLNEIIAAIKTGN